MQDEAHNDTERRTIARERSVLRFIFQNAGGLLALIGIVFSSGMFMQEITQIKIKNMQYENTMQRVEMKTEEIKTDVAVIRERVSNQSARLSTLENRK